MERDYWACKANAMRKRERRSPALDAAGKTSASEMWGHVS